MSEITPFAKQVYEYCRKIPKGKVSTYSQIAKAINKPKAYRAVGHALSINPFAPEVPCHRVVASDGMLAGFSGSVDLKGPNIAKKRKMLIEEGVNFVVNELPDKKYFKVSKDYFYEF